MNDLDLCLVVQGHVNHCGVGRQYLRPSRKFTVRCTCI